MTFESEETLCVLMFLHHTLFEIQKANLDLQKEATTAVDLQRIISTLRYKLEQRMANSFFRIHCCRLLSRMSPASADELKISFTKFIQQFLVHIDKYFSKNAILLEVIGRLGNGIEDLSWKDVQECIEVTKIRGLHEDNLFNELTELKITFKSIKMKETSIADQIRHFLSDAVTQKKSDLSRKAVEESTSDEKTEEETVLFRSDQ